MSSYQSLLDQNAKSQEFALNQTLELEPENVNIFEYPDTSEMVADSEISGASGDVLDKDIRKVYLTFDDGPSANTNEILDILKEYDVKATFFVIGKPQDVYEPMYKRIVEEGHTLGMHSYSHRYSELYKDVESFGADTAKLQEFLYERTGVWSKFYRFPGGSSNTVSEVAMQDFISYLNRQNITYFDWNISSQDAEGGYISKQKILDGCLNDLSKFHEAVILMHDATVRDTTVEALPLLIEEIQKMDNTVLLPITEETPPIQHVKYESEE